MTDDLRARLEHALGSEYRIKRELGGGGMSRVFVAEDVSLGREVVVKVLSPDLTSELSADRFRREIQLAARLQHPHIVPLFSAGQSRDLLYFTMPYVEGQSLRAKLSSAGELPVADAVRILRDVASALAHAHQHGVVHRDIKPENVLVSGLHAVVTDFGVAKALSEAAGSSSLTSAGLALGTPAYMSPEQAAADPATDHRADLYALGVLGYELLTGSPPFQGRAPAQLLAAHATESPEDITRRRATIPPPLASLVMRLLEKRPADRPQSADEVLRELDAIATPSGSSATPSVGARIPTPPGHQGVSPFRRRGLIFGFAGALLLVIVAGGVWYTRRSESVPLNPDAMVIAPFRVSGSDPSLNYLREGMVDLLAAKFTGEGGPSAADPRSVMGAWRSAASSADADLPEKDALGLAARLGAGRLVLGGIVGTSKHLVLNASLLEVPSGRTAARGSVEGSPDSLPSLVDRLAIQLLAGGKGGEQLASLTSLPALRAYLEGRAAYRRGLYDSAITSFQQALHEDSTFAMAALGLTVASNWGGSDEQRAEGERIAWAQRARLSPRDRAYLELFTGPRYPAPAVPRDLIDAGARAVTIAAENPEVWYEYGDFLYHEGPAIGLEGAHKQAAAAFARAVELDSSFAAPREHLIDLAARVGDTALVRRLGARYLVGKSTAGTSEYTRWRVAIALGDSAVARESRQSFPRMSMFSLQRIIGFGQLDGLAPGDVALAAAALRANVPANSRRTVFSALSDFALNSGRPGILPALMRELQPFRDDLDSLDWVIGTAFFMGGDTAAAVSAAARLAARLDKESVGSPGMFGRLCQLEGWRLSRGDTRTAAANIRRLTSETARPSNPVEAAANNICVIVLQGLADFAERGAAATSIQRVDSVMKTSAVLGHEGSDADFSQVNLFLAKWLESKGDYDGALAAVRRRLYLWNSLSGLFAALRQEGRLATRTGDRAGAIRAYRHYLLFRSNPDAVAKPQVDSVRAELAQLERGSSIKR